MEKVAQKSAEDVRCVLIVDDEPTVAEIFATMVQSLGCVALTAHSAEAGLKLLAQHKVSLVLTDFRMPHMNGAIFCMHIKQRYPSLRVAIISAYADEAHACLEAANIGADEVLSKPCAPEEIESIISRFLGKTGSTEDDFEHMVATKSK